MAPIHRREGIHITIPGFGPHPFVNPEGGDVQVRIIADEYPVNPPAHNAVTGGRSRAFLHVGFELRPDTPLYRGIAHIRMAHEAELLRASVAVVERACVVSEFDVTGRLSLSWAAIHPKEMVGGGAAHKPHLVHNRAAKKLRIGAPHHSHIHFVVDLWGHIIELHPARGIAGIDSRLHGVACRDGGR